MGRSGESRRPFYAKREEFDDEKRTCYPAYTLGF